MKISKKSAHRCVAFALATCILFCAIALEVSATERSISVSAKSAILIEASSGTVIYEKNAHEVLPMASTTKIMSAIVAIENKDLSDTVTVDPRAVGVEGSSVYLAAGEQLTLASLLYALLLASANDAAAAIAYAVAGSIEGFSAMMNEKAKSLGLSNTHFDNPHGLDSATHHTSAYDLAILSAYALKNETFKKICSSLKYTVPATNMRPERTLVNHNRMLRTYSGAVGVKTGFTKKSGRCLVSAAERDSLLLIAVTLGAPDDWNDHKAMLDLGFELYEAVQLAKEGEIAATVPVTGAKTSEIDAVFENDLSVTLSRTHGKISSEVRICRPKFAPIKKGDRLGTAVFFEGGRQIGSVGLVAACDASPRSYSKSNHKKIKDLFKI